MVQDYTMCKGTAGTSSRQQLVNMHSYDITLGINFWWPRSLIGINTLYGILTAINYCSGVTPASSRSYIIELACTKLTGRQHARLTSAGSKSSKNLSMSSSGRALTIIVVPLKERSRITSPAVKLDSLIWCMLGITLCKVNGTAKLSFEKKNRYMSYKIITIIHRGIKKKIHTTMVEFGEKRNSIFCSSQHLNAIAIPPFSAVHLILSILLSILRTKFSIFYNQSHNNYS